MINYLCFTFKYKCLCKDYSFYHLVNELAHMLARMMQKSGASKKNTLNQAPSLNACYQNPVINLKREKKKSCSTELYSLNYVFTPANAWQSFQFELLPVLQGWISYHLIRVSWTLSYRLQENRAVLCRSEHSWDFCSSAKELRFLVKSPMTLTLFYVIFEWPTITRWLIFVASNLSLLRSSPSVPQFIPGD